MDTVPNNFLGLEEKYTRYDSARFAVLPVPYDATTSYQPGTRFGPEAIITASHHVEWFDDEVESECHKCGIITLDPLEPNAAGPEAMHHDLFKHARRMVRDGKFLIGLGGEHGISSALVRAVMTRHKKLSVLQLDAHSDLRDAYQKSRYSHASVMRRIVELGVSIVPVGIRCVSTEERHFMKRSGIHPISARDCHSSGSWMDRVLDGLGDKVYITMDIDAFDPSFAPGTGTPEPGGLDWYQVTGLLGRVASEKTIVAADVVEVRPIAGQTVTEFLAARLVHKLMSYVSTRK